MESNTNLFGCCSGEKNSIIREYQRILAKVLIEDSEFFDEILPGLDINESFFGDYPLKAIVGTLIDMKSRYNSIISYDALEAEILRRTSNEYDREEIAKTLEVLKENVPVERLEMCKEQFKYWKQFVILAKIGNACVDMLREPWSMRGAKLNKMIEEVKDLAGQLNQVGGPVSKSNDWTD